VVLKASVARQADCTLCEPLWIKAQEASNDESVRSTRVILLCILLGGLH
jgi:hypothetical protein